MLSILGMVGLILSFFGSAVLAYNAIRSKSKILSDSIPRLPTISTADRHKKGLEGALKESMLKMPSVQALLWQSTVAMVGLVLLTIGFAFQLVSIVPTIASQ